MYDFEGYYRIIEGVDPIKVYGKVTEVIGLLVEGYDPGSSIGKMCQIYPNGDIRPISAEVVGFRKGKVLLMPLEGLEGVSPGCKIVSSGERAGVKVGHGLLGRVIDGLGNPIDDKGVLRSEDEYPIYVDPINPLKRVRIREPVDLGIRAINGLFSCGKGQRIGIFSGSGVGKSSLLGMIAKNTRADINVIGLVGERGREVREFIENNLGEEGLTRSVLIVATSDSHPLLRMRAAYVATSISEYFRDQGMDVLLMIDSLTRFAMAQREIGLFLGEPPTTKGYTPSVFSLMPKLLERAGNIENKGSITGLYTVLVEGDDFNEPIADMSRAILDGHITLSRDLAAKNHYPAIDVLNSISRVMVDLVDEEQRKKANDLLNIVATYRKSEDLINIDAYVEGSNPEIDYAIKMIDKVNRFLKQDIKERIDFKDTKEELLALFN
ncbi:MAG: flagellar protein export ATPase FliI [Deltaproteobacteria bacterium]|nr:flagellar protein export ATPase FliI [Deltaproteobacteria bacterium]MBW1718877.1 flagellar protein export ATPase FliI [Deltaproteobacteria bacterium]